ncbi:heme exporter protein CcmD [Rhizobium paknamense]|uniref:Heme exporter protein D n=1 Tax=Rhizobium paknamense TaxID=1206817 RepID=A0ABU0IEL9_9HYPH|nr:heme exporter protein CcmD [Rhizobium paknamense]MDQ0456689.1 heme exporter protein D [Rhizobium paknamense]
MSHDFYIYSAYGAAFFIIVCLILWVFLDGRARQKDMKALEAAGIRRRSATAEQG